MCHFGMTLISYQQSRIKAMAKTAIIFINIVIVCLTISCNTQTKKGSIEKVYNDSTATLKETHSDYKAIKFIDSFMNANNDLIKKSSALKEHYEGLCTKQILPLIDKKELYDNIPFELAATTTHNGTAYGNFIFDDEKHFIKVTCIIKEKQLLNLQEHNHYLIKFRTVKFQDGVSFENEFSKIELPTVNAYLTSFKPYSK